MRTITGKELDKKLLKAQGKTWDRVALPRITVQDLKSDAIQLFKNKAVARRRLTEEDASVADDILMENLYLKDEDDFLVRAAMLAFYKYSADLLAEFHPRYWISFRSHYHV